jgi:hypothetical protein
VSGRGRKTRRRVELDLGCQISPYTVYRRLAEGEVLLLVDLRTAASGPRPRPLRHALGPPARDWLPPPDSDVVLFDQDGESALERARELRSRGHARVWALFGGLDLWDLALGGLEDDAADAADAAEGEVV